MDEKREKEFNAWLESIRFVDGSGKLKPIILKNDTSPDPEGDRG